VSSVEREAGVVACPQQRRIVGKDGELGARRPDRDRGERDEMTPRRLERGEDLERLAGLVPDGGVEVLTLRTRKAIRSSTPSRRMARAATERHDNAGAPWGIPAARR
jgi:hypothetical protein